MHQLSASNKQKIIFIYAKVEGVIIFIKKTPMLYHIVKK